MADENKDIQKNTKAIDSNTKSLDKVIESLSGDDDLKVATEENTEAIKKASADDIKTKIVANNSLVNRIKSIGKSIISSLPSLEEIKEKSIMDSKLLSGITNMATSLGQLAKSGFGKGADGIANFFKSIFKILPGLLTTLFLFSEKFRKTVMDNIIEPLIRFGVEIGHAIQTGDISGIVKMIGSLGSFVIDSLGKSLRFVLEKFGFPDLAIKVEEALTGMEDGILKNIVGFTAIAALIAPGLVFGGLKSAIGLFVSAVKLLGSGFIALTKKLSIVIFDSALKAAGFLKTGIVSMASGLSTLATSLGSALVPLLPIIATVAAITLAVVAIRDAFIEMQKTFEETGSVLESLKVGISTFIGTIIGFPLNLLKDIVSWAAEKLGFDKFSEKLDGINFIEVISTGLKTLFDDIQNWMGGIIDFAKIDEMLTGVINFVSPIFDKINNMFNKMTEWIKEKIDIDAVLQGIKDIPFVKDVTERFSLMFQDINDFISETVDKITKFVRSLVPEFVTNFFDDKDIKDKEQQIPVEKKKGFMSRLSDFNPFNDEKELPVSKIKPKTKTGGHQITANANVKEKLKAEGEKRSTQINSQTNTTIDSSTNVAGSTQSMFAGSNSGNDMVRKLATK